MKFLKEVTESVEYLIEETDSSKPKQYFIEGIFMQGDVKNRNGRIYPTQTLVKEAKRYTEQKINSKQSLGELNHPDSAAINPERASHLITKLWVEGNNIMGRAKVLDTPMGKIVKTLMDEGIKIGVSSRGFGTVTSKNGVKMVGEDFHLATVDIVSDPSAPNAFVEAIMESKEYTLLDGQIIEVNEATEKAILEKHGHKMLTEQEVVEKFDEEKLLEGFSKLFTEANLDERAWKIDSEKIKNGNLSNSQIEKLIKKWGERGNYFLSYLSKNK